MPDSPVPNHGKARVLVVDDEEDCLRVLRDFLEMEGLEVVCARDGATAVRHCQMAPFQLVITDWQMPGMSGNSLIDWIQAHQPTTPVILITGWQELIAAAGMPLPPCEAKFGKPIVQETLVREVRRVLGKSQPPPART
ncbi:MAG: response regulator [Planctomycetes bacterium]|nr:response regulator [Planctomycetota bacterium]